MALIHSQACDIIEPVAAAGFIYIMEVNMSETQLILIVIASLVMCAFVVWLDTPRR